MDHKIKLSGSLILNEVYKNDYNKQYYAKITGIPQLIGEEKLYQDKVTFDVQLTMDQYNELKLKLIESDSKYSILKIKGELEIILDHPTIN